MGARGPKPDLAQAAKGNPGRRASRAMKAVAEAERIAGLLAPSAPGAVDLPAMLQDSKYAAAAAVWRKLAPELRRTHRLPVEAEFMFVQFCVYAQEWVTQTEDLHVKGFAQSIATVAGGKMERRRPMTLDRQQAFSNTAELSRKFGLTPMDMYDLFKGQAAVAASNPGLFGDDRKATPQPDQPPAESRVGGFARLRSTPPGPERPN
jgi:phage terminase small subunit